MHFMKKKYIITFGVVLIILGAIFGCKLLLKENTIIGTKDIFNDINTGTKGDFIVESLELKDEEEMENAKNEKIAENISNNKPENIIINNPVVKFEEEKTEIIEDKNTSVDNVQPIENNTSKDTFVKLRKNEKVIAKMEAMIFALVPTEWFFSNSKVIIDSNGIDESTEYLEYDKINQDVLKNKVSGDIKIYAYDEIWNNGTEYVLRTRCYIR